MFPRLSEAEVARLRRYGDVRLFDAGTAVYTTGRPSPGLFVVLSGHVAVSHRDGHGRSVPIVEHGPRDADHRAVQARNDLRQPMTCQHFCDTGGEALGGDLGDLVPRLAHLAQRR